MQSVKRKNKTFAVGVTLKTLKNKLPPNSSYSGRKSQEAKLGQRKGSEKGGQMEENIWA